MARNLGRVSGPPLKALLALMRTPARHVTARVVRAQLGIDLALGLPESARASMLHDGRPLRAREAVLRDDAKLGIPAPAEWQTTSETLQAAYRSGRHHPRDVVLRALTRARELARLTPTMGPIHREDEANALTAADESRRRFQGGEPRALEGVVIVVKEELDVAGLPTGLGTTFLTRPAERDATAV